MTLSIPGHTPRFGLTHTVRVNDIGAEVRKAIEQGLSAYIGDNTVKFSVHRPSASRLFADSTTFSIATPKSQPVLNQGRLQWPLSKQDIAVVRTLRPFAKYITRYEAQESGEVHTPVALNISLGQLVPDLKQGKSIDMANIAGRSQITNGFNELKAQRGLFSIA